MAFACGVRTGVFMTRMPRARNTPSNDPVYLIIVIDPRPDPRHRCPRSAPR
jgi:hypothetical protein